MTVGILEADGVAPMTLVGFNITNCLGVAYRNSSPSGRSIDGCMTFLDGQISMGGTPNRVAITNNDNNDNDGYDMYMRNVYFSGTTNLMRNSLSLTTVGAG